MTCRVDLVRFYQDFLNERDTARYIAQVASRYQIVTLKRLATCGSALHRRAAILALGFLGDYHCRGIFCDALHDVDRGVRLLAEDGVRDIWSRAGNQDQQKQLLLIKRLNTGGFFLRALRTSRRAARVSPEYAELWNQAAMANFFLGCYTDSLRDCRRVLELNRYQFEAAVGLGNCYLRLGKPRLALTGFRHAVLLNPNLEAVRLRIAKLRRAEEQF